jgi:hypothetical protein
VGRRGGRLLLMTALILGACSQSVDITTPTPLPTQAAGETTAPRMFVVDWKRAAETSAGDIEREVMPLRIKIPVPDGWIIFEGWGFLKRGAIPPGGAGVTFDRPLILYADRCTWDDPGGVVEIGDTVDDFVNALLEHPQYGASNIRDITVDGFAGKDLDMLSVPDGFDISRCSAGIRPDGSRMNHMHRPWPGRYWMGPTMVSRVRVIDVGGERVVIHAMYFSGTSESDIEELFEMLDSLSIEIEE